MAELVIKFPGGKPQSIKIKRWTKDMKKNLKVAMSDISVFMERDMKKKLRKPQASRQQKKRVRGGRTVRSARKLWASPSPFGDIRARTRTLMQSFGRGDPNNATRLTNEGGVPALHFGTRLKYARFPEEGTKYQKKRAYFAPEINKNKKRIWKTLQKALRFK